MGNKSQLMWQKGYAIKTKNHIIVDMCIGVPVFLRHSVYRRRCNETSTTADKKLSRYISVTRVEWHL